MPVYILYFSGNKICLKNTDMYYVIDILVYKLYSLFLMKKIAFSGIDSDNNFELWKVNVSPHIVKTRVQCSTLMIS